MTHRDTQLVRHARSVRDSEDTARAFPGFSVRLRVCGEMVRAGSVAPRGPFHSLPSVQLQRLLS